MIFRNSPTTGQYRTVALAFFDLLGFKDFLERHCADHPDFLLGLISTADFFTNSSFPIHLERRIISDSIIVWTEDLNQGILAICNIASLLQTTLLKKGCLIRGAIVLGKHFSNHIVQFDTETKVTTNTSDEILVSPALARAVVLEKDISSPEIVFDNNQQLLHQLNQAKNIFTAFRVYTHEDSNNRVSVQGWFTSHEMLGLSRQHSSYILQGTTADVMAESCRPQAVKELNEIREIISANLGSADERVKAKWQFIADKYNCFLQLCPPLSELKSIY